MVKGKQQRKIKPVMCPNTDLEPLVETHSKSVNLPYGLGGNYRHFRIDRRQSGDNTLSFSYKHYISTVNSPKRLGKPSGPYPARTIPLV